MNPTSAARTDTAPASAPSRPAASGKIPSEITTDVVAGQVGLDASAFPVRQITRTLLDPARSFLAQPGKGFRARVVDTCWQLYGESPAPPETLGSVVETIHAASLIVDDIEDGSSQRRSRPTLHRRYGLPVALNTGNWLYFVPFEMVERIGLSDDRVLAVTRRMTRAMSRCHLGQALDVGTDIAEVPQGEVEGLVETMTKLKTGALMTLATTIGPAARGADSRDLEALEIFGEQLGTALQSLDDVRNLRGEGDPGKRHEDLLLARATWVWAYLAEKLSMRDYRRIQRELQLARRGKHEVDVVAADAAEAIGDGLLQRARQTVWAAISELKQSSLRPRRLDELLNVAEELVAKYA